MNPIDSSPAKIIKIAQEACFRLRNRETKCCRKLQKLGFLKNPKVFIHQLHAKYRHRNKIRKTLRRAISVLKEDI